jgi:AcrR family transcriptional regulator
MDSRAAAAEATRERIVEAAYEQFLEQWYDEVTLRDLARRAGVALQTVVNHFGTKENVFLAVSERFSARIAELRGEARPDDPPAAAATLVGDYEVTGDAGLRALALEERVPVVADALAAGRRTHREWVEQAFPVLLAGLAGARKRRCLAELLTVTDLLTWKMLRRDQGLSRAQTEEAIRELLEAVYERHGGRRR